MPASSKAATSFRDSGCLIHFSAGGDFRLGSFSVHSWVSWSSRSTFPDSSLPRRLSETMARKRPKLLQGNFFCSPATYFSKNSSSAGNQEPPLASFSVGHALLDDFDDKGTLPISSVREGKPRPHAPKP